MKNTFLLAILLFQLTFVSGQSSNWGPWVQNSCFDGLYARFKKSDMYSEKYGRTWYIQFKNTYTQKIAFSFTAGDNKEDVDNNIANKRKGYRTELAANTTDDGLMWVTEFNETECRLGIGLLRFLGTNETDVNTLYANCKGGQLCSYCAINPVPNCPNYSKSKNSSSSTGTSTTQQNDLTEYNNSKADLERQIQEKNAQGQQKSQNYTTTMNAGISAYNSGNYDEAKKQFSIASNNYNTEEARVKAQEYYNKSVDAEKSQAKIKEAGNLVTSSIIAIDELSKAIREVKEVNEKTKLIETVNDMKDDDFFKSFIADVILTFRKSGYIEESLGSIIKLDNDYASDKSQEIYFNKFKVRVAFNIGIKNIETSFKAIAIVDCIDKKEWDIIKSLKILNKWEAGDKYNKIKDKDYSRWIQIKAAFDKKKIKDYDSLIKAYNDIIEAKTEKQKNINVNDEQKTITKGGFVSENTSQPIFDLSAEQLFQKGKEYYSNKDFQKSYQYYESASKKGYSEAMTQIGFMYSMGVGVSKDYNKAKEWYLKAIEQKNTHAMVFIAYLYEDGDGVPADINKALEWLIKASELGDASAMYEIGGLYDDGELIEQNFKKAIEWYEKSAILGNTNAMYNLAYKFLNGEGVNIDINKAKGLLNEACNEGNTNACIKLKKL